MKYQINLLTPKKKSFADQIIYFSFQYLRYILVITQLVVIGVFFFRIKIDQEIVDLKDTLKQKEEIVLISAPLLKEAKALDQKTTDIAQVLGLQSMSNQMLTYFLSNFPAALTLTSFKMSQTGIIMEGLTDDPGVVKMYYNRLKKDSRFKQVDLVSLTKKDTAYEFSFKLQSFVPQTNGQKSNR